MAMEVSCRAAERKPGILEYIQKNPGDAQKLFSQWSQMLTENDIDINLRKEMDAWFQDCYNRRNELWNLENQGAFTMYQQKVDQFCRDFRDIIETKKRESSESGDNLRSLQVGSGLERIKDQLTDGSFVKKAIECVENEASLIAKAMKLSEEDSQNRMMRKLDADFKSLHDDKKKLEKKLEYLKNEIKKLQNFQEQHAEKIETLEGLNRAKQAGKVDMSRRIESETNLMQFLEANMIACKNNITAYSESCINIYNQLQPKIGPLINDLATKVREWQNEYKLCYAELQCNEPDLDKVAPLCTKMGQLLYDLHISLVPELCKMTDQNQEDAQNIQQDIVQNMDHFFQRTFIVSDQTASILKCDKKTLPPICVRILGADSHELHHLFHRNVQAYLLYEGDLNNCWDHATCSLDVQKVKRFAKNMDKNEENFQHINKNKDCRQAVFKNLSLKNATKEKSFERNSGKPVHEEKYRFVFVTTGLNDPTSHVWTLSLPVIITTGANQGCLAQASITWACFGTDVYTLPIQERNALPWSEVAAMLNMKMEKLCPERSLNTDNLRHLKRRLLGNSELPDSKPITLKRFCFEKLEKSSKSLDETDDLLTFSFWKWFIGCYNLIERYLIKYWREGLIEGFISKEDAREKLRTARPKDGMFILRFSDTNLIDSQGIRSIFAFLTACVMVVKTNPDGQKMRNIADSMDVANQKVLEKNSLAKVLLCTKGKDQSSVYKVLYPGRPWDQTFKKHVTEDSSESNDAIGYVKPMQAWMIDLEQTLYVIEQATGKHERRPSLDSGFDPSSPASNLSFNGNGNGHGSGNGCKRRRNRNLSEEHPNLSSCLSVPPNPARPYSPGQVSDITSQMLSPLHSDITETDGLPDQDIMLPNLETIVEPIHSDSRFTGSDFCMNGGDDFIISDQQIELSDGTSFSVGGPNLFAQDPTTTMASFVLDGQEQLADTSMNPLIGLQQNNNMECIPPRLNGMNTPFVNQGFRVEHSADRSETVIYVDSSSGFDEEQCLVTDINNGMTPDQQQQQPVSQTCSNAILQLFSQLNVQQKDHLLKSMEQLRLPRETSQKESQSSKQLDSGGGFVLNSGDFQDAIGMDSGSLKFDAINNFPDSSSGN
ncbi:signal transducer and activator of transcription 1-like isoform X1 [Mya arenaria]|uniref:signal transducer and activator of transcription 1-like isoform X1 n=1 Tax=Mya arenaria TaxID=6604 RepID=UPI0022E01FCA|nr:signal transducer and activator of transcription 1-like isoform X1 [Mya arenaria]XP_052789608.1 signal transducer and activator of transcription 1-like isoform X1 [Mya arenaria]XP_052789609.1 signal transducer and activator of transcription 1-like isoform X1 [Mya arenaria]